MNQQIVTLLIGPPCIGKSTYLESQIELYDCIISSDNIVYEICKSTGITYSDFFELDFNHSIRKKHRKLFSMDIENSKKFTSIVWDLTNLNRANRKKAMSNYPEADFNAIEFSFYGLENKLIELNRERGFLTGKVVPENVLTRMFKQYEPVSPSENFKDVRLVNELNNILIYN